VDSPSIGRHASKPSTSSAARVPLGRHRRVRPAGGRADRGRPAARRHPGDVPDRATGDDRI